jgi:hypothetical protein
MRPVRPVPTRLPVERHQLAAALRHQVMLVAEDRDLPRTTVRIVELDDAILEPQQQPDLRVTRKTYDVTARERCGLRLLGRVAAAGSECQVGARDARKAETDRLQSADASRRGQARQLLIQFALPAGGDLDALPQG